jgi:hypothetical protein
MTHAAIRRCRALAKARIIRGSARRGASGVIDWHLTIGDDRCPAAQRTCSTSY